MRKVIIINDNSRDILRLQDYLKTTPGLLIAGIFATPDEAASTIDEVKYDIIISTVSVLVKLINSRTELPILVCVGTDEGVLPWATAKHIFAYLQAPFSYERILSLKQTIESFILQSSNTSTIKREYIFIKSEYKLIKINLADILFLSGLRDYTQLFLKGKVSPLTTLQNLKDFESKLPETSFIRVHRSYIVSISQIDSISRNEINIGSNTIPIGNAYRQLLDDMITKNS